ncbi:hypothetical protein T4B_3767, partial [Trichinella pseudospiralis]
MERTLLKAFMVSYSLNAITARAEHHSVLSFSFRPSCYIQHCANSQVERFLKNFKRQSNCLLTTYLSPFTHENKRITVHHNVVSDKKHQILHEDSSIKPSKPLIIAFSFEGGFYLSKVFKGWFLFVESFQRKISKLWKDIKEGKDFKGVERYQSNQRKRGFVGTQRFSSSS